MRTRYRVGTVVILLFLGCAAQACGEEAHLEDDAVTILPPVQSVPLNNYLPAPPVEFQSDVQGFTSLIERSANKEQRERAELNRYNRLRDAFRISTEMILYCAEENATAYQIKSVDQNPDLAKNDPEKGILFGYTILKQARPNKEQLRKVQLILTDLNSYRNVHPLCFEPGMIFQFKDGSNTTTVFICTYCGWAYIYDETKMMRMALTRAACISLGDVYEALFVTK
jgi:hypothetical protein